jgi:hypothetical protein
MAAFPTGTESGSERGRNDARADTIGGVIDLGWNFGRSFIDNRLPWVIGCDMEREGAVLVG